MKKYLFSFCLAISLCANIYFLNGLSTPESNASIDGTYQLVENAVKQNRYIVFIYDEQKYVIYEQNNDNAMLTGKFTAEQDNIFMLDNHVGHVIKKGGMLYFYDKASDKVAAYEKISDVQVYINVQKS